MRSSPIGGALLFYWGSASLRVTPCKPHCHWLSRHPPKSVHLTVRVLPHTFIVSLVSAHAYGKSALARSLLGAWWAVCRLHFKFGGSMKHTHQFTRTAFAIACCLAIGNAHAATISIQPIQVCTSDGSKCADTSNFFVAETNKIWAQAGYTVDFLATKTINRDEYFTIDDKKEFNALMKDASGGRSSSAYDMWIVDSIQGAWGQALLSGDGMVISDNIVAANRIDTIAHELGHMTGLDHSSTSIQDAARYLMAPGNIREIASGLSDIAPDGKQLDRFNPILPAASVDTIGSTPFGTGDFFKIKYGCGAPNDVFLNRVAINLAPVNAFVDSTNAPPGLSGSPLVFSNFNGLARADITATGFNNGSQFMQLAFAAGSFATCEGVSFGVDIDLFSNVDGFGATPAELNGAQVTFDFSNGYSITSALDAFIAQTTFDPFAYIDKASNILADPDPIVASGSVPVPTTLSLLFPALAALALSSKRRRVQR